MCGRAKRVEEVEVEGTPVTPNTVGSARDRLFAAGKTVSEIRIATPHQRLRADGPRYDPLEM